MTKVADAERMRHMLDFARKAREFSRGRTRDDLDSDEIYALAMARLLEVLGEAASQVSRETQTRLAEIPGRRSLVCAIG